MENAQAILDNLKSRKDSVIVEDLAFGTNSQGNNYVTMYVSAYGRDGTIHRNFTDWGGSGRFNGLTREELEALEATSADLTEYGLELCADVPVEPYKWTNDDGEEVLTSERTIVKFVAEAMNEALASYGLNPRQEDTRTEIGDEQPVGEQKVKQQA